MLPTQHLTIQGYHFVDGNCREEGRSGSEPVCHRPEWSSHHLQMAFMSVPPVCNLHCPYCYTDSRVTDAEPSLTEPELAELISELAKLQTS